MEDVLHQLTRKLVACRSTHDQAAEIERTAAVFERFFGACAIRRVGKGPVLADLFVPRGVSVPRVLLLGHMDVVPTDDTKMFSVRREGDRLYGRGTYDMKGPTAALAFAMKRVLSSHPDASVGLLITGDEERGGMCGTGAWVRRHVRRLPEVVFDPDGGKSFTLVQEEKGVLSVAVEFRGKAAHASRPWEGKNPLEAVVRGLEKLANEFPPSKGSASWRTTVVPSMLHAGNTGNQVPNAAELHLDIRYVPTESLREIITRVKGCFPRQAVRVLKQAEPFTLRMDAPPVHHLQMCAKALFGEPFPVSTYPSSCDARFFAASGVPVILLRPDGGGAHGNDEWVSLKGLEKYARLVERFIQTYR